MFHCCDIGNFSDSEWNDIMEKKKKTGFRDSD